jgi:carboxymethylenebutenolidase
MHKDIQINGAAAYHTYPDNGEKHPGLIVIEEIWGVNDHIRSVADRFVVEGFSVISPELLPAGLLEMLTPEFQKDMHDPEKRDEAQPKLREAMQPIQQPDYARSAIAILKACVDYLRADENVNGEVSVLGFCFGGSYSFHLAAHDDRIKAAVPFYGQAPSEEEIPDIHCPILAFYGDQDANLMASLPKLKEEMQKNGKDFEAVVYQDVGHAFFNDTNIRAYDAASAQDAWAKTISFLKT